MKKLAAMLALSALPASMMNVIRLSTLVFAAALSSGCATQESIEYQKEVDAVPMPTNEAERVQQCKYFNSRNEWATFQQTVIARKQILPLFAITRALSNAFTDRLYAMKCTQEDRVMYPKGLRSLE